MKTSNFFLFSIAAGTAFVFLRRRWLLGRPTLNGADLLRSDHRKTLSLFKRFEEETDPDLRQSLVDDIVRASEIHETIEEEIFYPAVRRQTGDDPLMDQARREHDEYNSLMAEMQLKRARQEPYEDLVRRMHEKSRQHIEMEEGRMLVEAELSGADLMALGRRMIARKTALTGRRGLNTAGLRQEVARLASIS